MQDDTFTLEDFEGEFIEEPFDLEDNPKKTQTGGANENVPKGVPEGLAEMFRDQFEPEEGNVDESEPEDSNSNSMPPLESGPEEEEEEVVVAPDPVAPKEEEEEEDEEVVAAPEEEDNEDEDEESNVDLGSVESIGDESLEGDNDNDTSNTSSSTSVGEVPEGDREESEFIINDDDFELLDSEKPLFIREEIELPEYKVITTEEEQIADVMNEIMRNIPEDKREDKKVLKRVRKQVESFTILKEKHSSFNDRNEIDGSKFLTRDYKPIVSNILNGDFSSKLYKPIVHQSKILYRNEIVDKEGHSVMQYTLDSTENEMKSNTDIISVQSGLRRKYKNTRLRQNYSYNTEMRELNETFEDYKNLSDNGYKVKIENSAEVFNACFQENDMSVISRPGIPNTKSFDKHIESGDINLNLDNNPFVSNNHITVTGLMKLPNNLVKVSNFLKKPLRTCIDGNYLDFSVGDSFDSSEVQHINLGIVKGTNVKVCLKLDDSEEFLDVTGKVSDILDKEYIVQLDESTDFKKVEKVVKVKKGDKTIKVLKSESKNNESNDRNCFTTEFELFKFPLEPLNKKKMEELLHEIVPNSSDVIQKHMQDLKLCVNLSEVNDVLHKYDLKTDVITADSLKPVLDHMEVKNETIINESRIKSVKFKELLEREPIIKTQFAELLNKKLLEEYREYYGDYPHYNTNIDSVAQRLKWLYSQYDQGTLLFKSIILKMFGGFYKNINTSRQKTTSEINKLEQNLLDNRQELNREMDMEVRSSNKCPDKKLVKIYTSMKDLEADNMKTIYVDEDKRPVIEKREMLPGEPLPYAQMSAADVLMRENDEFIVKLGHYCLLDEGLTDKRVFKRSPVDGGEIWTLESSIEVDSLVSSNEDFCNQYNMNISELIKTVGNAVKCFYDKSQRLCLTTKIQELLERENVIKNKLGERREMLSFVRDSENYLEHLKKLQDTLQTRLKLYRKLQENTYNLEVKKYAEVAEGVGESEHKELYNKIDKYLTSINKLPKEDAYKLIDAFLKKYGRNFDSSNDENPKNIYCKIGSKVLMCKHHTHLITFYTNPEKAESTLEYLKQRWCSEHEGKYYCTNCGNEVFDGEYEKVEGFASNGAYLNTTEVMDPDDDDKAAVAEVEYLEKLLEHEEDADKEASKLVNDIIKTLTGIMGIRLKSNDTISTIKKTLELNNIVIKQKDAWLAGQKKAPKNQAIIDKAYSNYKYRSTIINASAALFVFLQVNLLGYIIKKPHSRCKASLKGFPLDTDELKTEGIIYIKCILETLRDSGSSLYDTLKKIKIQETLVKMIKYCLKDKYIKNLIQLKRDNDMLETASGDKVKRNWNEFKPPLGDFNIPYDNMDVMESTDPKFTEHTNLLSLKVIENMNGVIDQQAVENKMYDPVPLGNTCCSETLNDNYKYSDFFKSDDNVVPLINILNTMDTRDEQDITSRIILDRNKPREKIERFDKQLFPEEEDETDRKNVFIEKITEGSFIGHPRIFDEDGICIITGQKKSDLIQLEVTSEMYLEFIERFNKSKLYKKVINDRIYSAIKLLEYLKKSNLILKENKFIGEMITNLVKYNTDKNDEILEETFNELTENIESERDDLLAMISKATKKKNVSNVLIMLEKIGELRNVLEDNKTLMDETEAEEIFYEKREKMLQNYFHRLRVIINSIVNENTLDSDIVNAKIPKSWKKTATESVLNKVVSNDIKNNKIVQQNVEKTRSKHHLLNITKTLSKFLHDNTAMTKGILGKPNILSCDNSVKITSTLSSENSGKLLQFLLILTFKKMITLAETSTELEKMLTVTPSKSATFEDLGSESSGEGNGDSEGDSEGEETTEETAVGRSDITELIDEGKRYVASFIVDFLKMITSEQDLLDKYTPTYIKNSINKVSDQQKEENLKFMEDLERESRQSLMAMLTIGVDSWKNLASKDKSLYLPAVEETERELDDPLAENIESDLRNIAARELGEDFSEMDFENWSRERQNAMQTERDALAEHVMEDDDGDDMAEEDDFDPDNF